MKIRNILLVYPEFLETFWGFKHLLKFVGKKAAHPPLGLLTVAAMLPKAWPKKLVDLNVRKLTNKDIAWADCVFIGAMTTQKDSAKEVIAHCNELGKPVVLGGPILEAGCDDFPGVSHFLLGEVENTLPEFLADMDAGRAKKIYQPRNFPNMRDSPIPLWELADLGKYASMTVQWSRGCPYRCTFCSIAKLNGRVPRTKTPEQFLCELDALYQTGYRGPIFIADDNFIGNKKRVKEMLHLLVRWQQDRGYPFDLTVEGDITLADDDELMEMLVQAGVGKVFLGIETPNEASLAECGKRQNMGRDLVACVKKIQRAGLVPMSGFIVGFDNDDPRTFADKMIHFIQETGIAAAMVGILQAQPRTPLYERLRREGRLLTESGGNNVVCSTNFRPRMPMETLVEGYKRIWAEIYSPRKYYERIRTFLREFNPANRPARKPTATQLKAFVASLWRIGLFGGPKASYYYWKTLVTALFQHPRAFPEAVALLIFGAHFQRIAKDIERS